MFSLYKKAYAGLSTSTWILAVVLLINRCGAMVIPFMTVYLTQQFHFSVQQAGLVMTCYGIGGIVGAFTGGRLSDRYGFYPVQFWSLFLQGLIFLVLGQMHTLLQFCICIFFLSAVGDAFRPANTAATAHYSRPENRPGLILLTGWLRTWGGLWARRWEVLWRVLVIICCFG